MLSLDVGEALLSGRHMQSSQEAWFWTLSDVPESDGQVRATDGYGLLVWIIDVLDGIDHTRADDRLLSFHGLAVVDSDHFHVLFVEDDLVNWLEVVDLLNLSVMSSLVYDFSCFSVHHVHLSGVLRVVLDLMLDQIGSQVGKLDRWSVSLIASVKQVDKLHDEIFSA